MGKFSGIEINVYKIINNFFGENITVSGLITGQDLKAQLNGKELGEALLIPCNMLRSGEKIFLDDMTVGELENALQVSVNIVESSGKDFLQAVVDREYSSGRDNENFVYIQAYDK